MNKTFEVEFREDHVYVLLGPDYEVTPQQEDEFWAAIEEACKKFNSSRVLVEGYVPKRQLEPVDVVQSGVRAAVVPKLWFALCLKDFEPTELSELFKTVAASRGVHVKFFSGSEKALNWLRSNSPDQSWQESSLF
ncbi:MAG: hypothetical protein M3449_04625 [Acidobacteriota bacterium]|nr:hypothetical protein [Acidobacteriota bacterium]MDQ3490337.1 hypothetical protein [Acidobacteriota bacterium]